MTRAIYNVNQGFVVEHLTKVSRTAKEYIEEGIGCQISVDERMQKIIDLSRKFVEVPAHQSRIDLPMRQWIDVFTLENKLDMLVQDFDRTLTDYKIRVTPTETDLLVFEKGQLLFQFLLTKAPA